MRAISRPRALPAVGRLVEEPAYRQLQADYSRALVVEAIRAQLAAERQDGQLAEETRLAAVEARLAALTAPVLRPVINATGVVLHTNLGRAPLSHAAVAAASIAAAGYTDLEFDLEDGRRGQRSEALGRLLTAVTGAESALVVNNNAAAVLLALTALARGREVVVSRGQQVEIGGSFRMPDVMRLSGGRMVEVGTTNRTRVEDYAAAITERTAALLFVHTSNFKVTGFTESASLSDLGALARERGLRVIADLGSGALQPTGDEPTVPAAVQHADVTTFSGDKLLGGPQAGIAVGRAEAVSRMARHPLARAVRVDKLTVAALGATLLQVRTGHGGEVPVPRMVSLPAEALRRRAALWSVKLAERGIGNRLLSDHSVVGAGSLPGVELPTWTLEVDAAGTKLAAQLRRGDPPVVARVEQGRCRLDPRTVLPGEDEALVDAVEAAMAALGAKSP